MFHRRAALDQLGQRLLDANRTIGQPNKITMIFGRKVTNQYKGKLQTVIEDLELLNPMFEATTERASSSSMFAITCACAPSQLPMASPTMGSRRLWKTYPNSERN
jgi:hypothetical protein